MLVLSRKVGEVIWVGEDVKIIVTGIDEGRVKLGFIAPPGVSIDRSEVRADKEADAKIREACRRTKSQVMEERQQSPTVGCCNRYADNMACDCLTNALPDTK